MPINEPTETFDVFLHEPAPAPFEAELRTRLHDILEEWESVANYEDPFTAATILAMSDQISDAMYPPEDADE